MNKDTNEFLNNMQELQQEQFKRTEALEGKLTEQTKEEQAAREALAKRLAMLEVKVQLIDPDTIKNWSAKLDEATTGMWDLCDRIKAFPKRMATDVNHRLEGRNKIAIIVIVTSVIITGLSLGLWANTFRENTRLRENDIKYRYLQVSNPYKALHIDSLFNNSSYGFEKEVKREESRQRALLLAETAAREKEQETKEANQRVIKLKQKARK